MQWLNMSDVESLLKAAILEMEKLLTSKTVIGDPITANEKTVIPLLSVGAGFGAGAGPGKDGKDAGGGAGGGFRIKPVAVIVIEKDEVRVAPIRDGRTSVIESVVEKIPSLIKSEIEDREKGKEAKKERKSKEKGKVIDVV